MQAKLRAWWQYMRAQVFPATASGRRPPGLQGREHVDADLRGAQITSEQLAQIGSLQGAILTDGTRHL